MSIVHINQTRDTSIAPDAPAPKSRRRAAAVPHRVVACVRHRPGQLVTIQGAASILQLHVRSLVLLVKKGELPEPVHAWIDRRIRLAFYTLDIHRLAADRARRRAAVRRTRSPESTTLWGDKLSVAQVAERMHTHPKIIRQLALRGAMPRPVQIGRRLAFHRDEIDLWRRRGGLPKIEGLT